MSCAIFDSRRFFQMRLLFQEVDIAILQNLHIQVMEKEKDELI